MTLEGPHRTIYIAVQQKAANDEGKFAFIPLMRRIEEINEEVPL
jgi:hypothetical protein